MMSSPNSRLRELLKRDAGCTVVPGAANALTARLIEEAGFEAVYLSGAGITNTFLGAPDVGLLSLPDLVQHVEAVREATELPIIVDADTGFGNAVNVRRTVRALERAGASAIQLEDQVSPKRCGHFEGKAVIDRAEMLGKVRSAVDARRDDSTILVARTDARATHGLDEACERAQAYLDAGADVAFVEAPLTVSELEEVGRRVDGPLIANMVEGGVTPIVALPHLAEMGFTLALYANSALRAAINGMRGVLDQLLLHGDTNGVVDSMATWQTRQALVRKDLYDQLEAKYAS
jgi:2-methylisocitrate lyase-like PEP mutase family enzyme